MIGKNAPESQSSVFSPGCLGMWLLKTLWSRALPVLRMSLRWRKPD